MSMFESKRVPNANDLVKTVAHLIMAFGVREGRNYKIGLSNENIKRNNAILNDDGDAYLDSHRDPATGDVTLTLELPPGRRDS